MAPWHRFARESTQRQQVVITRYPARFPSPAEERRYSLDWAKAGLRRSPKSQIDGGGSERKREFGWLACKCCCSCCKGSSHLTITQLLVLLLLQLAAAAVAPAWGVWLIGTWGIIGKCRASRLSFLSFPMSQSSHTSQASVRVASAYRWVYCVVCAQINVCRERRRGGWWSSHPHAPIVNRHHHRQSIHVHGPYGPCPYRHS